MAVWVRQRWEASLEPRGRRDQRGGAYQAYVPDTLLDRPLTLGGSIARRAVDVERGVRELSVVSGTTGLEGLARFLLRSEAMASSQIEGLRVSAKQVALAELAAGEGLDRTSFTENARLVANNIAVLHEAATGLADAPEVTTEGIHALHRALLPDESLHGLRGRPNWIGGSDHHPLDAHFVPPPALAVEPLMSDLVAYMNSGLHAPLVQGALVHAQFETVHPFADGNGRVGRALIHTVLTRRQLTPSALLPISLVLLTQRSEYIARLMDYRYEGASTDPAATDAVGRWVELFLESAATAVEQAKVFSAELVSLRERWESQILEERAARGVQRRPRSDAGVTRLLERLPEAPVMTARTAAGVLEVADVQARKALDELSAANVLTRQKLDRRTTGYFSAEVFELLTFTERALASTRWDTRASPPARAAPARPQG